MCSIRREKMKNKRYEGRYNAGLLWTIFKSINSFYIHFLYRLSKLNKLWATEREEKNLEQVEICRGKEAISQFHKRGRNISWVTFVRMFDCQRGNTQCRMYWGKKKPLILIHEHSWLFPHVGGFSVAVMSRWLGGGGKMEEMGGGRWRDHNKILVCQHVAWVKFGNHPTAAGLVINWCMTNKGLRSPWKSFPTAAVFIGIFLLIQETEAAAAAEDSSGGNRGDGRLLLMQQRAEPEDTERKVYHVHASTVTCHSLSSCLLKGNCIVLLQ